MKVVGISSCPMGIAHTYMAAEALEKMGEQLGHKVKVETHGSSGVKNKFTKEEIKIWLDSYESNFESIKNIYYDNN